METAVRLASALILSLTSSVLLSATLVIYLPFPKGDVLIWIGLTLPLLWSVSVFYCYWPENSVRPMQVLGGLTVICGLLIWLSW